jgi:hypothetical protein
MMDSIEFWIVLLTTSIVISGLSIAFFGLNMIADHLVIIWHRKTSQS